MKKPVVTIDFDHTLLFEDGETNFHTLKLLSLFNGCTKIILTTRKQSDENVREIKNFCQKNGLFVSLICFVPDEAAKLEKALELQSFCHFDDSEEARGFFNKTNIFFVFTLNSTKWALILKQWGINEN